MTRRMTSRAGERGSGVIENVIAMGLLGLTIVGSVNLHVYTLHANEANQNFGTLSEEVQAIADEYRSGGLNALLARFPGPRNAIVDGAIANEMRDSISPFIDYTVTFTAINSATGSPPQAVRVTIVAQQQRGKLGPSQYRYETIIAHAT